MDNQAERFKYYFMERNGLWIDRLAEYAELGGEASSIAKLIHACEIGDGIDQHASEDLKAVSAFIAAQADVILRLQAIHRGDVTPNVEAVIDYYSKIVDRKG